ncbi:hypothetical protein FDUTEX481_05588 [Tolypothrix sp. PCC 7601]|nr:hypothetical protein FDUTEX481_05588 [Tolypothrix sp. PCC 7601]
MLKKAKNLLFSLNRNPPILRQANSSTAKFKMNAAKHFIVGELLIYLRGAVVAKFMRSEAII